MKTQLTIDADARATVLPGRLANTQSAQARRTTPDILFGPPPRDLEPGNGEVHVFCAALDPPSFRLGLFKEVLSADERARAARFVTARYRNRFVAGRGTLREILGWLLGADAAHLVFAYGDRGKPRLAAPVGGRFLHFNLAHSDALAIYVVSAQHEVGIDLERIRPVREAGEIAARFFSRRDNTEWCALPAWRQMEAFFECWTRKESLLKAVGDGLCGLAHQSDIPLLDGCPTPRRNSAGPASCFSNFTVHSLTPAPGYRAAAATRSVRAPCCWKWPAQ